MSDDERQTKPFKFVTGMSTTLPSSSKVHRMIFSRRANTHSQLVCSSPFSDPTTSDYRRIERRHCWKAARGAVGTFKKGTAPI